jgi:hypothetical protein
MSSIFIFPTLEDHDHFITFLTRISYENTIVIYAVKLDKSTIEQDSNDKLYPIV